MLRSLLAVENPIHYDLLDAMYRLTEGNPFFLEEAHKSIIESSGWEHISPNDLPVPRTVQLAVQRRLDHLDASARNLVFTAAVIGRRFQRELLQKLLAQPTSEFIRQMLELSDAQMLIEESPDIFAFRHALTREAIYLSILGMERKRLHRLIAETLEQDQPGSQESLLNDLSYHFFEAGEWRKAGAYAHKAGAYSESLDDTRSALLHFTRAVEAARQLGNSPATVVWRARAPAHQTLGHFESAQKRSRL